jgi:hypothetical protein
MSEDLPWLKMLLLFGILIGMFVGPFLAIKLHEGVRSRRSLRTAGGVEAGDP